jgi:hypothetical protein
MAKKTVFQDIDPGTVSYLDISDGVEIGMPMTSSIETVLLTESESRYTTIEEILELETKKDFIGIKKVFVLQGCDMPADRLKAYLKEHKVIITNNYLEADAIITHRNISGSSENYGCSLASNRLMWTVSNGYYMDEINPDIRKFCEDNNTHCISTKHSMKDKNIYNEEYTSMPYDSYIISGLALELAKLLKEGNIESIGLKTLTHLSSTQQILTEKLLQDLLNMNAGGPEEQEMFYKLCPTIIGNKNIHFLWKLTQELSYNHNKDFNYWRDINNLDNRFLHRSISSVIQREHLAGDLTSEAFKYFEPMCRKQIYISDRDIYTFTVQILPEYRQYLTKKK